MAKEYQIVIPAHPSIYSPLPRELRVKFCEPEQEINSKTGLMLIISGFGDSADSDSSREFRNYAADKYNLVTIQCHYFGNEFMQNTQNININFNDLKNLISENDFIQLSAGQRQPDISKLFEKYELSMETTTKYDETLSNFNDMGLMQALDNIFSILAVAAIMEDNGYTFDYSKIIAYGESHGAYLSYLCNAFCPDLFSLIIDNSAWLYPGYLYSRRFNQCKYGKSIITIFTNYLAKSLPQDEELLRLPSLYSKFVNKADIISLHGTTDDFSSYIDIIDFCKSTKHSKYEIISPKEVDGQVFKSSGHCFDSKPCNIFGYVMQNYDLNKRISKSLDLQSMKYETSTYIYSFDYSSGVPILDRQTKNK